MHNIWSFICDYNNRILPNIRKNNRLVLLKIFEKWEIEDKKEDKRIRQKIENRR